MTVIKTDASDHSKQEQAVARASFFNLSRINRIKHLLFFSFWLMTLFLAASLASFILDWIEVLEIDSTRKTVFSVLLLISLALISGLSLMKIILLKIRRLHDFDCTGWWILLILVPLIGEIWGLAIFLVPGTKGENRYGPQP